MTHKVGPYLASLVLLFQSYKSTAAIPAELESIFGQGLLETYLKNYNEDFYYEGDVVDSFLERIFDIMSIPRDVVLRVLCGEKTLLYLTGALSVFDTIKGILLLKKEYLDNPKKFIEKYSGDL